MSLGEREMFNPAFERGTAIPVVARQTTGKMPVPR